LHSDGVEVKWRQSAHGVVMVKEPSEGAGLDPYYRCEVAKSTLTNASTMTV
jgi:hypothetical protein